MESCKLIKTRNFPGLLFCRKRMNLSTFSIFLCDIVYLSTLCLHTFRMEKTHQRFEPISLIYIVSELRFYYCANVSILFVKCVLTR